MRKFFIIFLCFLFVTNYAFAQQQHNEKDIYCCPMHQGYTSDKPGDCAICGMKLVKKDVAQAIEEKAKTAQEICILPNCPMTKCQMQLTGDIKDCSFCGAHLTRGKKILYYRNPMNPEVTSPAPMKDSMGMDYVPVYEEETAGIGTGIYMSQEKQQMIGVKKEKIEKRKLTHEILTVGKVAYDPELFVAQEEYLQALKVKEQAGSLADASKKKLLLLGMNEEAIEELAKKGHAQENLYLPAGEDKIWVYITIYEYEINLVKAGQTVELESIAFPGKIFKGTITAITPVLDSMTRSVQARAEVDNPGHNLKPQMFVNAKIEVDLGEKLAVSTDAVLDTGIRKIVYVVKEGDVLEQREVNVGQAADGFYEVLSGLNEGDVVVTSGNFLVDSESRLNYDRKNN